MPPPRVEDILTRWRSKGDITEDDYRIGLRIRQVYERSGMVGHAMIHSSSTQGRSWACRSGRQHEVVEHHEALGRMKLYLGEIDNTLVIEVVAKGRQLAEMDEDWAWMGGKEHVARRVRHALRYLDKAKRWGTDLEMTETGFTQADALERRLKQIY